MDSVTSVPGSNVIEGVGDSVGSSGGWTVAGSDVTVGVAGSDVTVGVAGSDVMVGVAGSSLYGTSETLSLKAGQVEEVGKYKVRLDGLEEIDEVIGVGHPRRRAAVHAHPAGFRGGGSGHARAYALHDLDWRAHTGRH